MSGPVLAAPTALDVSSTVAVSMPGPFVFTVVATAAVVLMVVVMIYFGFVVGSGPDVLDEVGTDSSAESDARATNEGDARALEANDARATEEERDEQRAEST